jgi:hypothetical protein
MAHFAELDQDNTVLRVIVVGNEILIEDGQELESKGIEFCKELFGENTIWMQTSYNGNIRKNYAGAGFLYDAVKDAFIPPKPEGDGWILNEETCQWQNPEMEALAKLTQIGVTRV